MRTKSTGGFTLIELLIVIAIIGILAAVLIPNLMSARRLAQERAAQSYSAQVYTAANAWLAQSVTNQISGLPDNCGGGDNGFTVGSAPNQFEVKAPGTAVVDCTIAPVTPEGGTTPTDFTVTVNAITGAAFVNGRESATN